MSDRVQNVVIVGGGTAGWMTAAYLSRAFNKDINITLIESPTISTVGVGEATFSTIRLFFDYLGLEEHDWMPHCNASYKMAIKFVNWNAQRQHFYHPFQRYETIDGFSIDEWWRQLKRDSEPFDYACFTIPALCDLKKSPLYMDGTVFDEKVRAELAPGRELKKNLLANLEIQYPYAYHFDASLLANFMRDYATQRGAKQLLDDVLDVRLTADGRIDYLVTKEHGQLHADLFVDCTGFRGLLINQALGEPFISFAESLPNDRAVAMQVPRDIARDGMQPYTSATALSAGWVWNIPLYGRDGTGYVYSSAFLTPEAAEQEFREHLGPAAADLPARHIKMRIGRSRNSWVKNCVAIGLASGFVEPLESTGIFFIQHGIEELVTHFPSQQFDQELIKSYNRAVANCIDGVREFLTLHYYASSRADTPYWKATKHDFKVSDDLKERLALWRHQQPNSRNTNQHYHGFESYSYSVMLLGLAGAPERNLPSLDHIDDRNGRAAFQAIKEKTKHLSATLPSQYEYLTMMYERAGAFNAS